MRALVIDDERLARKELINLLNQLETVEVVGEAVNVEDAKEKIDQLQPDVIFLDIQMPEKTGFDLLEELDQLPHVIFTTAYDEYALKAFQVNALDERLDEKSFFRASRKHIINPVSYTHLTLPTILRV